ncbi:MAG: NAD(P)/FAD-dependent oxidoreductase [Nitrospiraceae bacterium]|nr:MAG: NAD(P)/FAD-dependent oxidoreductase [Nitrospiraceae bacterium]
MVTTDKTRQYDLIVIGTGDAGKIVAVAAARAGWKVAVIEKNRVGGTCALWGCVPKKVLITGAELADFNRRMHAAGLTKESAAMSWSGLMKFKQRLTGTYSEDDEKHLQKLGIHIYRCQARFINRSAIEAGGKRLESRYVYIAAGARPRQLNIEGENHLTSSAQFLYLETLPRRILFIGGGYISFEFAHVAARYGTEAVILHKSDTVLRKFDPDLAARLVEASKEAGIRVVLNETLRKIKKYKKEFTVIAESKTGEKKYSTDMVVHGAGRLPDIDDLNLEQAGIQRSPEGIMVNEYMQSISNDRVYAAGDATAGGIPLTPVAMCEGEIVADNLVHGLKRKRPDFRYVPSVVFSLPKLASAGMHESDASEQNRNFIIKSKDTSPWLHNERVQQKFAGSKILIEKDTGKILGAHILDSHADDLINIFALAMQHGLTVKQIREVLYAYPSATSSIQYMVE